MAGGKGQRRIQVKGTSKIPVSFALSRFQAAGAGAEESPEVVDNSLIRLGEAAASVIFKVRDKIK